ncbi:phospholipase A2 family protein [Staphylococcus chromogenes]|uniref:phospholipase A2 family protein n=1 Tax=Staphylococcus chromogenes TaxID=46126 RepID=UPI002888B0A5|nr:phospholipase A2 family protein [Staphylococcus chromogenes]MDT0700360.1 phospholipase A2 family protein [Staphylococcus chromogenes]
MKKLLLTTLVTVLLFTQLYSVDTQAISNENTLQDIVESVNGNDGNADITDQEIEEFAKIGEVYESYIYKKGRWYEIDDKKLAESNLNEAQKNELQEYILTKNQLSDDTGLNLARAKWMFYGRYCGKGNKGGKPIDDLDAACKRHDECYAKHGWGKCKCDKPFIKATAKVARNKKYSSYKRKKAAQASVLFSVAYKRCK